MEHDVIRLKEGEQISISKHEVGYTIIGPAIVFVVKEPAAGTTDSVDLVAQQQIASQRFGLVGVTTSPQNHNLDKQDRDYSLNLAHAFTNQLSEIPKRFESDAIAEAYNTIDPFFRKLNPSSYESKVPKWRRLLDRLLP